jgi:hypothetical protein
MATPVLDTAEDTESSVSAAVGDAAIFSAARTGRGQGLAGGHVRREPCVHGRGSLQGMCEAASSRQGRGSEVAARGPCWLYNRIGTPVSPTRSRSDASAPRRIRTVENAGALVRKSSRPRITMSRTPSTEGSTLGFPDRRVRRLPDGPPADLCKGNRRAPAPRRARGQPVDAARGSPRAALLRPRLTSVPSYRASPCPNGEPPRVGRRGPLDRVERACEAGHALHSLDLLLGLPWRAWDWCMGGCRVVPCSDLETRAARTGKRCS